MATNKISVAFLPVAQWKTEIDLDMKMLACSACRGRVFATDYAKAIGTSGFSFCPYCGAKMENADAVSRKYKEVMR